MLFGKYVNKFYKKYAFFFIAGILLLIAVDWIQLYIPEFTGNIVTLLTGTITPEAKTQIGLYILYILLVAVGMFFGRLGWRACILFTALKIERDIRRDMFMKAERLSLSYFHENSVGTVMAWFTNDLDTIQESFGWGINMMVDGIFLLILTVVKMFVNVDWFLSVIALAPVILIVIWGMLVEKAMSEHWDARQKSFDKLYDFTQENFTGIRVIKAFVKENQEIFAFSKVAKNNYNSQFSFVKVSIRFDVAIEVIISLIVAVILGFGGWFVYAAASGNPIVIGGYVVNLETGKLVEFLGYFDTLIWPLIALGQMITMRAKAKASLSRIVKFIDAPEDISDRPDSVDLEVKGKITFSHFFFKYPDNVDEEYLHDINLMINPGETIGVVGKIGCGKSTLMNSLLRLYNVTPRSVFIDDVDIMDIKLETLRKSIAVVPQENFLFSDTIESNINFANNAMSLDFAKKAAAFAGVNEDIMGFSKQYSTVSGERGVTLSGGQKQRISLARAFAKDAPIMILDDSVSAVDLKTEELILKNIKEQRKGKTTIVVASRVSTVSHFDRIIVLNDGKLEAFDTPINLMKNSPTYQKMVFLQKLEKEVEGR